MSSHSFIQALVSALIVLNVLLLAPSINHWLIHDCFQTTSELNINSSRSGRIAIVRPFTGSQLRMLFDEMRRWNQSESFPCDQSLHSERAIDLIYFYRYDLEEDPEYRDLILSETWRYHWAFCFKSIEMLGANLNRSEQLYLVEGYQDEFEFGQMVAQIFKRNLLDQYNYFFFMGLDSYPVRSLWLGQLYQECFFDHDFWMKGSLYQGQKYVPKRHQQDFFNYHMNGDAIYNLQARNFRKFIEYVVDKDQMKNPLDIAIWKAGLSKYFISQKWIHKFVYTPYIVYLGSSSFSHSQILQASPETFILRKKLRCSDCDPIQA
eukprot:TRINITY_DN8058_c0_g1_i1.p1 TRINITY_DN8058_c0_g1~~TRINITY_DN8058_c0_g1_i1.p1  ORF type:complete len:320 (-),score=50.37 TRINITY_DN8058_c0_g1_i1:81-1040(-)